MNNYIITALFQAETDIEALNKAAQIAKNSREIAYVKHGNRDLGFVTKEGDVGFPSINLET